MQRTGIMAPPTLYDSPPQPGLMAPTPGAATYAPSPRAMLWVIAAGLASVELAVVFKP